MCVTWRNQLFAAVILLLGVQTGFAQMPGPVSAQLGHETLEDRNGPLLIGSPLLDGPRPDHLGWFATVDVTLLDPHVNNLLTAPVSVGPNINQVHLPSSPLHWTAAPRLEVGYRLGEAAGEIIVSYRFLASTGTQTLPDFGNLGNTGALRSRLNMNLVDVDYGTQENSLQPWLHMKWRVGVRFANLYFDSAATSAALDQHVTNYFTGVGPHVALDLSCPVIEHQLGLFCKMDAAEPFGRVQQGFEDSVTAPNGSQTTGFTRQYQYMPTTTLNVQAGVAWTPHEHWRLSVGYSYEHWWDATFVGNSRGDVWAHGVLFRSEWKY